MKRNYSTFQCLGTAWQLIFVSLISIVLTGRPAIAQIAASDYVTTWQTGNPGSSASNQITIPASGEYTIYYESIPAGLSGTLPATGTFSDFQVITFPSEGTYRVAIKPTGTVPFHRITFLDLGDRVKAAHR